MKYRKLVKKSINDNGLKEVLKEAIQEGRKREVENQKLKLGRAALQAAYRAETKVSYQIDNEKPYVMSALLKHIKEEGFNGKIVKKTWDDKHKYIEFPIEHA